MRQDTILGVGTAAALWGAIGDVHRFSSARKLVAYLGLDPKVRQSGNEPARHGHISKRGNSQARTLLVEAAWTAIRSPGPLRAFGQRGARAPRRPRSRPWQWRARWPASPGRCWSAKRTTLRTALARPPEAAPGRAAGRVAAALHPPPGRADHPDARRARGRGRPPAPRRDRLQAASGGANGTAAGEGGRGGHVGHIGLRIGEQRIRADTDPGPTGGVDNVDEFVGWFADWWLRRGQRLTAEHEAQESSRADENQPDQARG